MSAMPCFRQLTSGLPVIRQERGLRFSSRVLIHFSPRRPDETIEASEFSPDLRRGVRIAMGSLLVLPFLRAGGDVQGYQTHGTQAS